LVFDFLPPLALKENLRDNCSRPDVLPFA